MISWKNLDTLAAWKKLSGMKDKVNLPQAMAGEAGAQRVAKYCVPMAGGLVYSYAAKAVDDEVLAALEKEQEWRSLRRRIVDLETANADNRRRTGEVLREYKDVAAPTPEEK